MARLDDPDAERRLVGTFGDRLPDTTFAVLLVHEDAIPRFEELRRTLFKRGAILINTARGELVDETALIDALEQGQISMACLDVFAQEPLSPDHPLLARNDVLATPHMAWLTQDMFQRALRLAIENTHRTIRGEPLLHQVQ